MSMEISNAYSSYTGNSAYAAKSNNQKQAEESRETDKTSAEPQAATRKTAADELSYLSKKYSNYSFVAASYTKGMRYGSNSTVNVAIDPRFLKKMANDPGLAKEYEEKIADMQKIDEAKIRGHEARGSHIIAHGWAIDKDGGMSSWTIGERTNKRHYGQEMTDYANKIRRQKAEKAKEQRKLEEKRQAIREEKAELEEKMQESGKAQYGDKFKEAVVMIQNDEEADADKNGKKEEMAVGINLDMKI